MIAPIDAVLRRALVHDREHRPASIREFARDLQYALAASTSDELMPPSEFAALLTAWLGASLARQRRDLAELTGHLPASADTASERTVLYHREPATRHAFTR